MNSRRRSWIFQEIKHARDRDHAGEQHHRRGDAIDADMISDAEGLDPDDALLEGERVSEHLRAAELGAGIEQRHLPIDQAAI